MQGTSSLCHRCFPHLRRRELLASLRGFSFGKRDVTKGGTILGVTSPKLPNVEQCWQSPPGEGLFPAHRRGVGMGAAQRHHPAGCQRSQHPRASGNGPATSGETKSGAFLHHCPGTSGLPLPGSGNPGPKSKESFSQVQGILLPVSSMAGHFSIPCPQCWRHIET